MFQSPQILQDQELHWQSEIFSHNAPFLQPISWYSMAVEQLCLEVLSRGKDQKLGLPGLVRADKHIWQQFSLLRAGHTTPLQPCQQPARLTVLSTNQPTMPNETCSAPPCFYTVLRDGATFLPVTIKHPQIFKVLLITFTSNPSSDSHTLFTSVYKAACKRNERWSCTLTHAHIMLICRHLIRKANTLQTINGQKNQERF